MTLQDTFAHIDRAVEGVLDPKDADGHPNLPDYHPGQGPRYAPHGYATPLSVFRGEAMALYLIAQTLQPSLIVEMFTGTGYAASCLALGAPHAEVITVDSYQEGNTGIIGWATAREVTQRIGVPQVRLILGSFSQLDRELHGREPDLLFLDGEEKRDEYLAPGGVVVTHDESVTSFPNEIRVLGGSYLAMGSYDGEKMGRIWTALQPLAALGIPVARLVAVPKTILEEVSG